MAIEASLQADKVHMASSEHMPQPLTPAVTKHNAILSSSPAFATPVHPVHGRSPTLQQQLSNLNSSTDPSAAVSANGPEPLGEQSLRINHILPILLPPSTLRPIAFRTFTKKHNLTLTASALSTLATFVGKNCGQGWREDGLAELVLEEVARSWKKADGRVIVDTDEAEGGARLKAILRALEAGMSGGRIAGAPSATMGNNRYSGLLNNADKRTLGRSDSNESFGISNLEVEPDENQEDDENSHPNSQQDVRHWLKLVNAAQQPRMVYNAARKQFERSKTSSSLFSEASDKTEFFRQRYHLMHQRLMRMESFQASAVSRARPRDAHHAYQVMPIANLLGRSGSGHLLLGMLSVSPAGTLMLGDLTGSITLDLEQAMPFNDVDAWLCPGMIVLVDGIYEEDFKPTGGRLGNMGGVGGMLGGRFVGFSVGAPRCETREHTLGISNTSNADLGAIGGGFGWVDFLGVGSERALGSKMRRIEQHLLRNVRTATTDKRKVVILGEVTLDNPKTLSCLYRILNRYANASDNGIPMAFVLMGSFISQAAMSSPASGAATSAEKDTSSIAYKEHFDALANILSEFPVLLQRSSFIFVPGDNDPWPSTATGGAATLTPRSSIPEMFTLRIRRAFAAANSSGQGNNSQHNVAGEALWASNPTRLTLFGCRQEIVIFRDNLSGRLRRTALKLKKQVQEVDISEDAPMLDLHKDGLGPPAGLAQPASYTAQEHARRLTKTLLDQSHLSPFPLAVRPVNWSHAHALSLYPLPSALILCDAEAEAFALVYQGCCVVNAGKLINAAGSGGAKTKASWIEYDALCKRGTVQEMVG